MTKKFEMIEMSEGWYVRWLVCWVVGMLGGWYVRWLVC